MILKRKSGRIRVRDLKGHWNVNEWEMESFWKNYLGATAAFQGHMKLRKQNV